MAISEKEAVVGVAGVAAPAWNCSPTIDDALLGEMAPQTPDGRLRLLVWADTSPVAGEVLAFARALSRALHGYLGQATSTNAPGSRCGAIAEKLQQVDCDLMIWGEPDQTIIDRLISGPSYQKAVDWINASLLVLRRPRWPIRHLLLLVYGDRRDDAAEAWAARLAQATGARVTVLTIVPPVPAMYFACRCMQTSLDDLLTTNTDLGRQIRRLAEQLVAREVDSTLRLRQGLPDQQIQWELAEREYDLIVVAADPRGQWRRSLLGDRAAPLLNRTHLPVLVAKPQAKSPALPRTRVRGSESLCLEPGDA